MEDDALLKALEQAAALTTELGATEPLLEAVQRRAREYQTSARHWMAISLLARARQIFPAPVLDRSTALALGESAELAMKWADHLRIPPPLALLAAIEADLLEAIQIDPTLPDPFWDLSVINARFRGNYPAAAQYLLNARQLGYQHPMMERLVGLIRAKPPLPPQDESSSRKLRELLLLLALQAVGPQSGLLDDEGEGTDRLIPSGSARTFGEFVEAAKSAFSASPISEAECLGILAASAALGGAASDYVADLLRRVAEARQQPAFLAQATERHLRILVEASFVCFEQRSGGGHWLRKARRAAERGLRIVESSTTSIPPDLHAELLIAKGQALFHQKEGNAAEAIRTFHRALQLKRRAGNEDDVAKMQGILWQQIDDRVRRALAAKMISGLGQALEVLAVCAEVAWDLDNPERALGIQLHLASLFREVGQYGEAEPILQKILATAATQKIFCDARFELASVYSETSRPREAARLQKLLIATAESNGGKADSVLWSNYANSLRVLGDFAGARKALENAWDLLPSDQKERQGKTVPSQGVRIKMLQAQVALKSGDPPAAMAHVEAASLLDPHPFGLAGLHAYRIKAQCLLAGGHSSEARQALDTALHNFQFLLRNGPTLPSWESLLQQWSGLDTLAVKTHLESDEPGAAENGLLRAESAKGRVLAWLESRMAPKGAEWALSLERQQQALANARRWLKGEPGRRILSLFGSDEGLAVFGVDGAGAVAGAWFEEFNYKQFCADVFEPWEKLLAQTFDGTPDLEEPVAAATDRVLEAIGNWLERGQPALKDGGAELVIIPHRLFRNLPIRHAKIPGAGRTLSDLFKSVLIVPSLAYFGEGAAESVGEKVNPIVARADADGSLPFARCEAFLCAGLERAIVGEAATLPALREAMLAEGTLLLSLHAEFDRDDPFQSKIHAADGAMPLYEPILNSGVIKTRILVLAACEAGMSRRSLSDEPLGFPALLLQAGASMVVAPLWKVDDLASFLFVTGVFEALNEGADLAAAVHDTSVWLRDTTADQTLRRMTVLMEKLRNVGPAGCDAMKRLEPCWNARKAQLQAFAPEDRPFSSPLDWMAYQVTRAFRDYPPKQND